MAYPSASGVPSHSGSMHPTIWAGKMLRKFYEATCLSSISNTDYEGLIKAMGDKVVIRTTPDIDIQDYHKGQTLINQRPEPDTVELLIDKGKYWSFISEDVDEKQSDYDYEADWTGDAAKKMKIKIERDIFGDIYADAHAANSGTTAGKISGDINLGTSGAPIVLDPSNVMEYIVDLGVILDEQDIDQENRGLILPAWVCGMIKKSDLRDASLAGDGTSIFRNGSIGMLDRFEVFSSNLLNTVSGKTDIIACHKSALTFANQFVNNESLRAESTFGTLNRGLSVYGYEVKNPEALVHGVVSKV